MTSQGDRMDVITPGTSEEDVFMDPPVGPVQEGLLPDEVMEFVDANLHELTRDTLERHLKSIVGIQKGVARSMGQMMIENGSLRDRLKGIKEYTIDLSQDLDKRMEHLATGLSMTNQGLVQTNEKMDALGAASARSGKEIQQQIDVLGEENSRSGGEIQHQIREILTRMDEAANRSTLSSIDPMPATTSSNRQNNIQVSHARLNDTSVSQISDSRVLRTVMPDQFRGKNQSIRDYLTHFNMYAELSNWDEYHKQRVLLLSVKDGAADYLYGIDRYEEKSYDELCTLLTERFEEVRLISAEKLKLSQRKKEKGESWYQLVQDIEKMCAIVYRGGPHIIEREAKAAFIQNLPEAIKGPVAAANPKNIKEAVQTVIHMCSVLEVDECGNAAGSKLKVRYTRPVPIQEDTREPEEFDVGFVNTRSVDKTDKECFYCHKLGHFIGECRKRLRNEADKLARSGDGDDRDQNNADPRDNRNPGQYNNRNQGNYNGTNQGSYNNQNSNNSNYRGRSQQDARDNRDPNQFDSRNNRNQDNQAPRNAGPGRNSGYFNRNAGPSRPWDNRPNSQSFRQTGPTFRPNNQGQDWIDDQWRNTQAPNVPAQNNWSPNDDSVVAAAGTQAQYDTGDRPQNVRYTAAETTQEGNCPTPQTSSQSGQ